MDLWAYLDTSFALLPNLVYRSLSVSSTARAATNETGSVVGSGDARGQDRSADRWRPLAAYWTVLAATVVCHRGILVEDALPFTLVALLVAAYSAAVYSPHRALAVVSVLAGAVQVVAFSRENIPDFRQVYVPFILLVLMGLAANAIHLRQQRARVVDTEQETASRRAIKLASNFCSERKKPISKPSSTRSAVRSVSETSSPPSSRCRGAGRRAAAPRAARAAAPASRASCTSSPRPSAGPSPSRARP